MVINILYFSFIKTLGIFSDVFLIVIEQLLLHLCHSTEIIIDHKLTYYSRHTTHKHIIKKMSPYNTLGKGFTALI